jgi:hypothetical protein
LANGERAPPPGWHVQPSRELQLNTSGRPRAKLNGFEESEGQTRKTQKGKKGKKKIK